MLVFLLGHFNPPLLNEGAEELPEPVRVSHRICLLAPDDPLVEEIEILPKGPHLSFHMAHKVVL